MAGIPYKYSETFARLQRATEQLHALIASGEFYTYGYLKRRKLLRRVRKLYNQLAGPVSPAFLGSAVAAAGVLTLAGCFPATETPSTAQVPAFGSYQINPFGLSNLNQENPSSTGPVAIADLDGDGDLDLLYSGSALYQMEGLYSEGIIASLDRENIGTSSSPAFSADRRDHFLDVSGWGGTYPDNYGWGNMRVLAAGDLDGDGDVDLIAAGFSYDSANTYDGFIHVIENVGSASSASFSSPVPLHPDAYASYEARAAALVDLDGDGDLDLVYLDSGFYNEGYVAYLSVVENERDGTQTINFAAPQREPVTLPAIENVFLDHFVFGAALTDLDADGDIDVLVSAYSFADYETHLYYFENEGSGSFAAPLTDPFGLALPSLPTYAAYSTGLGLPIAAADFDGDGDVDLLFGPAVQYNEVGYSVDFLFFENQAID
jgi:hypothetical protein